MNSDSLDHLRIASPCSISWETMKGDDRVRFCDLCNLHVYNFAELTRKELADLVISTEGRLCGRLYRRADGTVITKDCPVGLRAIRKRVATTAGAVFATLLSLCSLAIGQKPSKDSCTKQVTITRKIDNAGDERGIVSGVISDPIGARIKGAKVVIIDPTSQRTVSTETNDSGEFRVAALPPSTYEVRFEAPGFRKLVFVKLQVGPKEKVQIDSILALEATELIGVIAYGEEPLAEPGKLVIKSDLIHRIPR